MSNLTKRQMEILKQKESIQKRYRAEIDYDNYIYIPAKKQRDFYDTETIQRVAVYVRVSTDDVKQTTSYEIQKKYYEEFVSKHSNWKLVAIYADEGITGTSTEKREDFKRMIADAKAGHIDIIITKSVSRFSRNIIDCITIVQDLAFRDNPVGVFFETECIFSLNDDTSMALNFQAMMAQEESHAKSRSMEQSLRMRLDHGIPLTPDLFGFRKSKTSGRLQIYEDEAPTAKLAFYMYLEGYSTQEIADTFMRLGRVTRLGNKKWTSNSIIQILRSERYCGDVTTRKTYTPSFLNHKSKKNRGARPQSEYHNFHDRIISRDDFLAVQRMLDNAKYGNKSILPQLQVIPDGLLKGYVVINPRWGGFSPEDYFNVSASALDDDCTKGQVQSTSCNEIQITVEAGDFDMRGFQVTRGEFLDSYHSASLLFMENQMKFSVECIRKFSNNKYVELLIHPIKKTLAVRVTSKENRNSVQWAKVCDGAFVPREIAASAFTNTIFSLLDWNTSLRYRVYGEFVGEGTEQVLLFDTTDATAYVKSFMVPGGDEGSSITPLFVSGKHVQVMPQHWADNFGKQYYEQLHDQLTEDSPITDMMIHHEGLCIETGRQLFVTTSEERQKFIDAELLKKTEETIYDAEQ